MSKILKSFKYNELGSVDKTKAFEITNKRVSKSKTIIEIITK